MLAQLMTWDPEWSEVLWLVATVLFVLGALASFRDYRYSSVTVPLGLAFLAFGFVVT